MAKSVPVKPDLKPMGGVIKGQVKVAALTALPHGSPQELADKANEIAIQRGYEGAVTPENFKEKTPAKTRTKADPGSKEPTISELRAVKKLLEDDGESITGVKEMIEKLNGYAKAAGGMDRLNAVVDFWAELEG